MNSNTKIKFRPRYFRFYVDPGVPWREENLGYAHLDWEIDSRAAALVLVDVWSWGGRGVPSYLESCRERTIAVTESKIKPLVERFRKNDIRIIHAPSPDFGGLAMKQKNWVHLVKKDECNEWRCLKDPAWPPQNFVKKQGRFKYFAGPKEARRKELENIRKKVMLYPGIEPMGAEPVIATGAEFHRYCKREKILHLFYVGFHTNCCILARDYGVIAMNTRGYNTIFLRDCTTGIEGPDTLKTLMLTRAAIYQIDFNGYTADSEELEFVKPPTAPAHNLRWFTKPKK